MTARRIRVGGHVLRVADDQPTFWDRVEAGTWEPATFAVLDRHVDARTTVVDLGAWVGPVTLYAAALGARVIAVEADPAAFAQLGRNLAVNPDLAGRVTRVPRAVSPQAGPVRMGARRKPGDSMSSVLLGDSDSSWETDAVTPAELAELAGGAERLFVKIDLEGAEYCLLPALAPLVERPDCAILVSFHPAILTELGETDPSGCAAAALRSFGDWRIFSPDDASSRGGRQVTFQDAPAHDHLLLLR